MVMEGEGMRMTVTEASHDHIMTMTQSQSANYSDSLSSPHLACISQGVKPDTLCGLLSSLNISNAMHCIFTLKKNLRPLLSQLIIY